MIYTYMTMKAMNVAYRAHSDQTDRAGVPYIFHPIHLAEQMDDEDSTVVALLHDVVEDTDIGMDQLAEEGFSKRQLDAVKLLTREDPAYDLSEEEREQAYLEYVRKISLFSITAIFSSTLLNVSLDLRITYSRSMKILLHCSEVSTI